MLDGSKALLMSLVDKLKGERPLTRKTFDRYSTLMSRIPGVTVQAQVPPPGTTDGASTLHIGASRKPFTTSMSFVEGSRDSTQALFGASSNSQTAMAEQLTLSGLFPGKDKEHYYRLDYSQYLNAEGTQLRQVCMAPVIAVIRAPVSLPAMVLSSSPIVRMTVSR